MNPNASKILNAMEQGLYVSFEHSLFKLLDEKVHTVIMCTLDELKEEIKNRELVE